jgi:aspartate/methionine/tyrosine aminotransferase
LAEALHDRDGVPVVPGRFFELPGTIRLSWLQAGDRLDAGLERLAARLLGRGWFFFTASTASRILYSI